MVQRVHVPAEVDDLQLLDRVDYQDAFRLSTDQRRTPEEWARLAVDGAPAVARRGIRRVHRMLGLRLADPGDLLGWTLLASSAEVFVLGADGTLGSPRIVVLAPPGEVVFTTLLRLDGARSRMVWLAVAPLHRAAARYLVHRMSSQDAAHAGR